MLAPGALEQIYLRYYKMVWNLCYTYLHHVQDVEDAVQDTFLHLSRCRDELPTEQSIKAWLITAAKNVCKDELKKARRKNLELDAAYDCSSSVPEPDETLAAVRALPEKYQTPLYLFYYEGMPTAEIARILHRKESTVRSDLRRGREKLRQQLERSTT